MKITLTQLDSLLLKQVSFEEATNTLQIIFKHSAEDVYVYNDVEVIKFEELRNSESLGSYFAKNIRNNYEFEKIEYPIIMESEIDMVDHNKEDK